MNQTGVWGTGSRRQARRNGESVTSGFTAGIVSHVDTPPDIPRIGARPCHYLLSPVECPKEVAGDEPDALVLSRVRCGTALRAVPRRRRQLSRFAGRTLPRMGLLRVRDGLDRWFRAAGGAGPRRGLAASRPGGMSPGRPDLYRQSGPPDVRKPLARHTLGT